MRYQSAEDRLNPITPEGVDETTLGGYAAVHGRAAAFEGSDGEPYTVAIEAERAEGGEGWVAYLVFLRWSRNGSAVMGHVETGDLAHASSDVAAREELERYPLARIRALLEDEIARRRGGPADA